MLSVEETGALISSAQSGDEAAKERLIKENLPLVKSIVRRFKGRLEYDDLMQLGAVGFLKAVMGFDASYGVRFSTYAVPMIAGEIKRFLRDDGAVRRQHPRRRHRRAHAPRKHNAASRTRAQDNLSPLLPRQDPERGRG